MPDYFIQAAGGTILFIWWITIYRSLGNVQSVFRGIISAALVPVALGLSLGYVLLLAPTSSPVVLQIGYATVTAGIGTWMLKQGRPGGFRLPDPTMLLPILISIPVFLIVTVPFSSFDPANYALISKAILHDGAIRDFPFVLSDRSTPIFSWFAHPPLLPLIYSWLEVFRLDVWSPYVGTYYFMLLLMLFFPAIRRHTDTPTAAAFTLLMGSVPLAVTTASSGFTASLRMFFFTATPLVMVGEDETFQPTIAGITAGAAMASHTIGLLTVPAVLLYVLVRKRRHAWKPALQFLSTAAVVGAFWYGWNLWKLGALNTAPLFQSAFPGLIQDVIEFQFRQRGMESVSNVFLYGVLGPVTRISAYGFSYIIGLVLLAGLLFSTKKRRPLPLSLLSFLLIYLLFHIMPGHFRIAMLSPRYPLTVLPLVLIAGSRLTDGRIGKSLAIATCSAAFLGVLFFWNPYQREPDHYDPMASAVNRYVRPTDRVLVVHSPYFFLYNNRPGRDSIDPVLADLYRSSTVNDILDKMKRRGFTHILMPWAPSPFESSGFVRQLFTFPGLVQPVFHSRAFHLYRIRYPGRPVPPRPEKRQVLANDLHRLPALAYPNTTQRTPIRFWDTGREVRISALGRETVFAFAEAPLWAPNAGPISVQSCRELNVSFSLSHIPEPIVIHPVIAQYDREGRRIALSHPHPITLRRGMITLTWPTAYPGFDMDRLRLHPACSRIAIGLNFYRKHGGMSLEALEVVGFGQ